MFNLFKREITNQDENKPATTKTVRQGKQVATVNSPFSVQTLDLPYNPDDLYQKNGGYDIYYEMLKDDQVKALLETKKNTMVGAGWEILSPTDVEGNEMAEFKEVTDFIKDNFENLYDGTIDEAFFSMLTSMEFGFSLSEQVYKMIDNKIVLSKLVQVPPDTLQFNQDEFGNVTEILQDALIGQKSLPVNKFVHFTWNMRDGNPYGNSDLRPAYIYWFSKMQVIKYRNIFLERHGFPIAVAKYNPNEEGQVQQVQQIVKSIQAATSIAIPESMDLEYKQPKIGSSDPFDTALRYYDKKISTSLLLPDLLGFNDTKEGSLALGRQHFELFISIVNRYKRLFEDVINDQIIKKLVDVNFPGVTKYPKIKFKPVLEQDHTEKINTFVKVVKDTGLVPNEDDFKHIKQVLGFPATEIKIDLEKLSPDKKEKTDEPKTEEVEKDVEKFSDKINTFLAKACDRYIIDLIGGKLREVKDLHYLGSIKTQLYRAFKVIDGDKFIGRKLNESCEEKSFLFAGDLSNSICSELRNINIDEDRISNAKKIENIFKKYSISYTNKIKNFKKGKLND